jgi:hypothetical protein
MSGWPLRNVPGLVNKIAVRRSFLVVFSSSLIGGATDATRFPRNATKGLKSSDESWSF